MTAADAVVELVLDDVANEVSAKLNGVTVIGPVTVSDSVFNGVTTPPNGGPGRDGRARANDRTNPMTGAVIVALVAALLGGGGLGGAVSVIIVKRLNRDVDRATAEATRAAARQDDVATLRAIITEVRQSDAEKAQQIQGLEKRIEKLEERERHMLTRAAVHEAWDQMAFQALIATNPQHPPPPPLIVREALPPGEKS